MIYPTMDSVIAFFKKNEMLICATIIGSKYETTSVCESKLETYKLLHRHVKCPVIFQENDQINKFPLFTKPIIGYGSRNAYKINEPKELNKIDYSTQLLLEYLPGKEYTIDCFTGEKSKLLFVGARERIRTVNGISVNTKTDSNLTTNFIDIANIINSIIEFEGSWFFQMKEDEFNKLTLLEIACRFAGSSSVQRVRGVNFALANLYLKMGINPEFLINAFDVELDRALNSKYLLNIEYDSVYIDLDDTVIINNNINIEAISFIYQCINNNIVINLITKHYGNLNELLNQKKIEGLFDKIFHLNKEDEKYDFINLNEKSIFIDDSFIERKKVFDKLSIPVFGVDAIKALLR
jgi:hypothetical protein